jgi:putative glutamine amidotransferase
MKKERKIGVLANSSIVDSGRFFGIERTYVNRFYVDSVERAGGVPFLLPIVTSETMIETQVNAMDALLFSGGQDIDPSFYGEKPSPFLESVLLKRDHYELALIRIAFKQKKPILGICRGMQLINVAFGGTLYQDLPHHFPKPTVSHNQEPPWETPTHEVTILPNTKLHSLIQTPSLLTNSIHHQAVKDLATGFQVSAHSSDGVIEAIERPGILGVQWHPEMMSAESPPMQALFDDLVRHE